MKHCKVCYLFNFVADKNLMNCYSFYLELFACTNFFSFIANFNKDWICLIDKIIIVAVTIVGLEIFIIIISTSCYYSIAYPKKYN